HQLFHSNYLLVLKPNQRLNSRLNPTKGWKLKFSDWSGNSEEVSTAPALKRRILNIEYPKPAYIGLPISGPLISVLSTSRILVSMTPVEKEAFPRILANTGFPNGRDRPTNGAVSYSRSLNPPLK